MITVQTQEMDQNRPGKFSIEFRGLSDDTKPTGTYGGVEIANGSIFLEIDTQAIAFYDESTSSWLGGGE